MTWIRGAYRWTVVVISLVGSSACTLVGSAKAGGPDVVGPAFPVEEPPSRTGNMAEYRVNGVTYRVLDTSYGYEETGMASWYGEQFHGRPTSSMEPFDMNGVSAAHRSLPIPSWVRVTNLSNGRRLMVRVNDRGPFADTDRRIIDLSYGAAVLLGMVEVGVTEVRIEAVEPWQSRTSGF